MATPAPGGWQTHTAPDGRPYFLNPATGKSSWAPPGAPDANASPSAAEFPYAQVPAEVPLPEPTPAAAPAPLTQPLPKPVESSGSEKDGKGGIKYVPPAVDARFTLDSLVAKTGQRNLGQDFFELERDNLLEINLGAGNQWALIKRGGMVARRGNVKFSRHSIRGHGLAKLLQTTLTGQDMTFMKCEGEGKVFVADCGKVVSIVQLNGQSLSINGNDVLAISGSLKCDVKLIRGVGKADGGIFNCRITGSGVLAFTSYGNIVSLTATPSDPVFTDPNATVAWTHDPTFITDTSMKNVLGRTTGEEFQLCFKQGYVIVQPCVEASPILDQ